MNTLKQIVLFVFSLSLISCANGGGVPLVQFIPNNGGGGRQFAPPPPPMMVVQPPHQYYQRGGGYGGGNVRQDGYNYGYGGNIQGVVPHGPGAFAPRIVDWQQFQALQNRNR